MTTMGEYRILEPVIYAHDGIVTQHKKAGAIVELSDDVAFELGVKLQQIHRPDPEPETTAEPVPNGTPATVLDPPEGPAVTPEAPTVTPDLAPEPETTAPVTPETDEVAKPRRGSRRGDDG